jgi:hypothetical protein
MHDVKLTKKGFRITFTKPVDLTLAEDLEKYSVERWGYHYHPKYGSPKTNVSKEKPTSVQVSKDGLEVRIGVTLEENRVYKLNLGAIAAKDGSKMANAYAWYTLNRLKG